MKLEEKILEIDSIRNDLFAEFNCEKCWNKYDYQLIRFTGYNDANFFDNVNAEFRERKCPKCGHIYNYKWTPEGVIVRYKKPRKPKITLN